MVNVKPLRSFCKKIELLSFHWCLRQSGSFWSLRENSMSKIDLKSIRSVNPTLFLQKTPNFIIINVNDERDGCQYSQLPTSSLALALCQENACPTIWKTAGTARVLTAGKPPRNDVFFLSEQLIYLLTLGCKVNFKKQNKKCFLKNDLLCLLAFCRGKGLFSFFKC